MSGMERYCVAYVATFFEDENGIARTLEQVAKQAIQYVDSVYEAGRLGYLHRACSDGKLGDFMAQEAQA